MADHTFCKLELACARSMAKDAGVTVPKHLTGIGSMRDLWFIEGDGISGEYVKGCCATGAKARYIGKLIDKAEGR